MEEVVWCGGSGVVCGVREVVSCEVWKKWCGVGCGGSSVVWGEWRWCGGRGGVVGGAVVVCGV